MSEDPWERYGAKIGTKLGKYGGRIAKRAFNGLKARLLGRGDYQLQVNSLVEGGGVADGMEIVPRGDGTVEIHFREYLGDITSGSLTSGSSVFTVQSYPINVGLVQTFPWFSSIAQQYDEWEPVGICFEYKSQCADYSSNQTLGSIIMATEYNVMDTAYANKSEMLQSAFASEAKPTEHILHGVECDPSKNPRAMYYTRCGNIIPTGDDKREYDLGTFYIASQGQPTANMVLGSLYVHGHIILGKQQSFNGIPCRGPLNYGGTFNGTINGANPLGSSTPSQTLGNFTPSILANAISLPTYTVGARWHLTLWWGGASATITAPLVTGCTTDDWGSGQNTPVDGASATRLMMQLTFPQTSAGQVITIGTAGTIPGSPVGKIHLRQITDTVTTYA